MAAVARIEALKGHGAMLVFAALISGSFSLGHRAAPHIDPALLNTLRFALGALILAPFALPHLRREHLAAPWRYLVLGAIFGLYFYLMFVALRRGEPVALAAVFTLTPLMSAGLGRLLLGQPATPRILLSLLVAACGALWVIFRGDLARLLALDLGAGELIYLAACFLHALYTPLVRRLNRGEPVRVFTFGMMLAGTLVLALLSAPAAFTTDWGAVPGIVWVALAYLVVFATTGTFLIVQYATLRLPASKVMAYGYLVPSFVILWQGLSGFGWVEPKVLIGAVLTVGGLLVLLGPDPAERGPAPRPFLRGGSAEARQAVGQKGRQHRGR